MKIVFMGTPDFAKIVLEELIESRHQVDLVVTQKDKPKNRGKKVQMSPVKELALAHKIKVLQPEKVKNNEEFYKVLKAHDPDIIIVVAYGQIIPKEILTLPRFGCINVHASLLPLLRGAAPIQYAIITGEEETGITIMQMDEGLDTGDMISRRAVQIGDMNYRQLHDVLADLGKKLLLETLDDIEKGLAVKKPQDDRKSSYAGLIKKQDGRIDFNKSPEEIERLIRGFDPWPGAFCNYGNTIMKFWKAEIIDARIDSPNGTIEKVDSNGITVVTGGKGLLVKEIQVPGKKRVKVSDFIKGNTIEKGKVLK